MHNWRLLLLACLAAFQPIASFTERSLVDGRQQCSQQGLRDTRLSIYGTNRHAKPTEERRLNYRDTRVSSGDRRYEVRDGNSVLATSERRADLRAREETRLERSAGIAPVQYRTRDIRDRSDNRLARSVDDWRNSLRDTDRLQRSRDISRERLVRDSRDKQNDRQQREASSDRLIERRTIRDDTQRSRLSVDARRDSRRNGDFLRDSRHSESRSELHRSRDEVARMEPARQREETRVSMERARQMDRAIGSRRNARLQHRERALGRLARDEAERRSSSLNSRTSNVLDNENRRVDSRDRFAVDRRDVRRVRDSRVRDSRDERNSARREDQDKSERSTLRQSRDLERRTTERFAELRSRDIARSRNLETRTSELQRSRDLEKRSTERSSDVRGAIDLERRSNERSRDLVRSSDAERRTLERSTEFRSRDVARARSLEERYSVPQRAKELESLSTERSSDLRRSRDLERRSNERSTETRRARDFARSRSLETRFSPLEKRSSERSSELRRTIDVDRRSTDGSTELRRSRDLARSRSLETRSARTGRATAERRESRSLHRQVMERQDTRRSYDQESRVQTRAERRSDLSRRTNEMENRRIVDFRSEHFSGLESRRNVGDIRTRDREVRNTVLDTRRVESRRMNGRESERRDFRNIESSRRSFESINIRLNEARNIRDLALERDAIVSLTRANVDASRNRNAWRSVREKPQIEAQSFLINWQYLLYTVQAIYLASFLVKMLGENGSSEKKIRSHGLWMSAQKLLKLE